MIPSIRRNLLKIQLIGGKDFKKCLHITSSVAKERNESSCYSDRIQTIKDLLDNSTSFVETSPKETQDEWTTLPYAEGTLMSKQEKHDLGSVRTKVDPRDTSIILFPGEGAQFVGMARSAVNVPVAKDVFDYASEILKYDLLNLCNNGPKVQLNDIRYSHVAIMTASLANLEMLREERPDAVLNCVATAGFSLGEITALVFAGALQFDEALQLVQIRAEAIHAANEIHKGGMATIYYGPDSEVKKACIAAKEWCIKNKFEKAECFVSNYMYPKCKIISGSEEALQYFEENLEKYRIRTIQRIKNAQAAHCRLMEPTIEPLRQALKQMIVSDPIIRVYSNVSAKPYANAKHIEKLLPQQLVKAVRWEQTMHNMFARRRGEYFPRTIVCGPNVVLKNILFRVNLKAFRQSIHIGDVKQKK